MIGKAFGMLAAVLHPIYVSMYLLQPISLTARQVRSSNGALKLLCCGVPLHCCCCCCCPDHPLDLRYYVAEGVRRFAQETWRQVMGNGGRMQVAKHINQVEEILCRGCFGHP
jgi:hypothetical protein